MEIIKPCPFCGRRTVKIVPFDKNKYIISHWYDNISDCPIATADEDTGIGTTYFETEEEAIKTWNQRRDLSTFYERRRIVRRSKIQ